jgi:hypothetical protein
MENGETERAEALYDEIEPLSAKIIDLLNRVEQHVTINPVNGR